MKTKILLLPLLFLVSACLLVWAAPFDNSRDAYKYGYDQGYRHGVSDHENQLSSDFRSEFHAGISYDSYEDPNFRSGYAEGYQDGYSGHRHDQELGDSDDRDHDSDHDSDVDVDHDSDHHSDSDDHHHDEQYASDYQGHDTVRVFTEDKFKGESRDFAVGHYPKLKGEWNDSIESIQMNGHVRVILFDKEDFQGQQLILEHDVTKLDDLNFEKRAASMIIEPIR
jgi:hypothetical protein